MKVIGEVSIDNLVDSHRRIWDRSPSFHSRRWYPALRSCLIAGVGAGLIVTQRRLLTAVIAAGVAGLLTVVFCRPRERTLLRIYLTEQFRCEGPFSFAMELTDDRIEVEQAGVNIKYLWSAVESVDELADGIEFWMKPGGLIVVRSQWFDSPEHQQEFVSMAQRRMQMHAQSSTL